MKAIVVEDFKKTPRWTTFADPVAGPDEVVVRVAAAALSNLVKSQSSGTHYSSLAEFPYVPGTDGVGRLRDGSRVFFFAPKRPFGSMGEYALVHKDFCVALPADLDDVVAAAIANPVMSSWAAITRRAKLVRGESVLINGATGSAGRLAVKIAKHLGAAKVIVTGRDTRSLQLLSELGADEIISLLQPPAELLKTFRNTIQGNQVAVILDYLWGTSAESLIGAIGGPGAPHSARSIRYVQIGSISGQTIALPAAALRSTGLELMGSGLGSVSDHDLVAVIAEALGVAAPLGLEVEMERAAMTDAETAWTKDVGRKRLVFTLP